MSTASAFLLLCGPVSSRFALRQRGEKWELVFDTFETAYEQAVARATGPTPLVICNKLGMIILHVLVSELPEELSKARRHWQELAATATCESFSHVGGDGKSAITENKSRCSS